MAKRLSKSRYTAFCQCPKNLWLKVYKPEEAIIDPGLEARFEQGNIVGDLAMQLFGEFKEVTTKNPDGSLDLSTMCKLTQQYMADGIDNICEASFSNDNNYCAVDILRRNKDGWDIYEVKSSSYSELDGQESDIEIYAPDIAYQKWLLTKCGIKVINTYLVCLNSDYVRHGDLDIQNLFIIVDMRKLVENEYLKVPAQCLQALKILNTEDEPDLDLSENCKKPYECAFLDYCKRIHGIPQDRPTVFNLYRMKFSQKLEHYYAGRITFDELRKGDLNDKQQMQVECTLNSAEHINPDGIRTFLKKLYYPLYFLDFETMQDAVPQYEGTKPYQQITFQYSLHIKESETSNYIHKEFLALSDGSDPRRKLAEQLCKDIPMDVCTLAYNKAFECTRINELAGQYPDLSAHLLNISDHIVDLIEPFRGGDYYVPTMGGSFSIKSVLPALFPDEPTLNYHNLDERVQNGGDAMHIFPRIKDMSPEEAQAARSALLEYCKLDTWAMVKVWEKLKEVSAY